MSFGTASSRGLARSKLTPGAIWQRNPSWAALPAVVSSDQKVAGLVAVFPTDGNFLAMICNGAYTVDWGDGTVDNVATGVQANHEYVYTNAALANTNAPVTLTDAGDLVGRTAHGYSNGMPVRFYNIVSTTGVAEGQTYYVVNATANTFQVAASFAGAALALTTDGSATLLQYKQAVVTVTPQAGSNLTRVSLGVLHNQSGLAGLYSTGWLDLVVSMPNATSGIGIGTTNIVHRYLERTELLNIGGQTTFFQLFLNCAKLRAFVCSANTVGVTAMGSMFSGCRSLQAVPLFNTAGVTSTGMSNMFSNCTALQSVPLFNTALATNSQSMFNGCSALQTVPLFNTAAWTTMIGMFGGCSSLVSVPLFNTALVTSMSSMFNACSSLQTVPLFNTASVTDMSSLFGQCLSLQSVPLFDTSAVTTMSSMFNVCSSLQTIPLFNTAAVTSMSSMFNNCAALQTIPLFNTAAVTNMSSMFNTCPALQSVPALNLAAVTVAGRLGSIFSGCPSLSSIKMTGIKLSLDVTSCHLSAAALDELYGNLATVAGQTITVTGNYGTASDTPTIATAKGWTVTG